MIVPEVLPTPTSSYCSLFPIPESLGAQVTVTAFQGQSLDYSVTSDAHLGGQAERTEFMTIPHPFWALGLCRGLRRPPAEPVPPHRATSAAMASLQTAWQFPREDRLLSVALGVVLLGSRLPTEHSAGQGCSFTALPSSLLLCRLAQLTADTFLPQVSSLPTGFLSGS